MRDRRFWEEWLRRHAEELAPSISSIREWYRAAGVRKGERRHFRSALQHTSHGTGRRGRGRAGGRQRGPTSSVQRPVRADRSGGTGSGPLREGRLRFTREGRPIVLPDSPEEPAIRIPHRALAGAWPADRVEVRLERRRGGAPPFGRIVRVVERGIREFVGRFAAAGEGRFVRYRDREGDLLVPVAVPEGLHPRPGDLVLVEVSEYPRPDREGRARLLRVLGPDHTMETIVLSVVSARNLPSRFPEEVLREAEGLPRTVRFPERAGGIGRGALPRTDQRHLPFVTIDGEDARDFDDAVCLVREGRSMRLFVAIADVSHYVPPGSAIDREAWRRGTSVYFPDRCIPMLPPALSEGICSLRPRTHRLAMTVEIPFSRQGIPQPPSFYPSVIRSRARLTYTQVHAHLAGTGAGLRGEIGEMLREMAGLAGSLSAARAKRGAIDLELPEAKIEIDGERPSEISWAPRWESHRLIEEFMLLANTAVAEFLVSRGVSFPFRIHEPPEEERVREFEEAAARMLRRSRVIESRDLSRRLQAWADAARGTRMEKRVHLALLRSLMLARYGPEEKGHFGLALSRYTHFTSPIRRYPDLVVHRALRAALGDRALAGYAEGLAARGAELGEHTSARERAAMDAERDVAARSKALFLSGRVGETFPARIGSVTRHGFFVELEDLPIEGYVPAATLRDDVYRFSEEREEWYGRLRKRRLAPADRVRVRLFRADVERGEIDFVFVEKLPESL
ncbi:MAG: ribonuclease R [Deltaproteobacteria bacterium]